MKKLLVAVIMTLPMFASAAVQSNYVCGSMGHAEDAVTQTLNLSYPDKSAASISGSDELLGSNMVIRKVIVGVYDAHMGYTEKYQVSYNIVRSFDGPDGNGDYCNLNGITKAE